MTKSFFLWFSLRGLTAIVLAVAFLLPVLATSRPFFGNPLLSPKSIDVPSNIQVRLVSSHDAYKINDNIRLMALLINNSQNPVYVFAPLHVGQSASFSIWVTNVKTGHIMDNQSFIEDYVPPPPASKDSFVRISSNHVYGVVLDYSLHKLGIVSPGRYKVCVVYHSPVPAGFQVHVPVLKEDTGNIKSNVIIIDVENNQK